MAFNPRAALRPLLATATVAVSAAGFAGVAAAQDGGYHGPFLSWTGKTAAPAAAPEPPRAPPEDPGVNYVAQRRPARLAEPAPASYAAPAPERAAPSPPPPRRQSRPRPRPRPARRRTSMSTSIRSIGPTA
jgi:hypothetical protein